jgi:DNA-binding transcriptional LysR family regulator
MRIEPFGGATVIVTSKPVLVGDTPAAMIVQEVLDRLAATAATGGGSSMLVDEVLHGLACRAAIKAGELDGGAIVGTVRGDDLVCHPLGELDYVLVAPAAWRERLEHARPAEIAAQPWVVTGGSTPSQELIERLFREEGLDIRGAVEVSHASLLRAMVAGGIGIGFVQRMEANAGAAAGRFYELSQFQASLPLSFVHRSAQAADEVLTCFTEALGQAWLDLAGADVADPGVRDSVP